MSPRRELPEWPTLLLLSAVTSLLFVLSDVLLAVIAGDTMDVFFDSLVITLLIEFLIPFLILIFLFRVIEKDIYGVAKKHPPSE